MTALARGLAVLGHVAEHGPLTAEEIVAGTDERVRLAVAARAQTSPNTPGPLLRQLAGQVVDALDAPQEAIRAV